MIRPRRGARRGARRGDRDGRRVRLAVWLTALILVPLTAIGWQLVTTAIDRSATATESARTQGSAAHLIKVVDLGVAVIKERLPTTLVLSDVDTDGRTPEEASTAMGGNLSADLGTSRAATDRALVSLQGEAWLAAVQTDVDIARNAVDKPALRAHGGGAEAAAGLRRAQRLIEDRVLDEMAELGHRTQRGPDLGLRNDLAALQTSYQLMIAFADEGASAFALAGFEDDAQLSSTSFDSLATSPRVTFALANAWYRSLSRQLERQAPAPVARRYREVTADPDSRTITSYFDRTVAFTGSPGGVVLSQRLSSGNRFESTAFWTRNFLGPGLAHLRLLNEVVAISGEQVAAEARTARDDAGKAYRQVLLIALGVGLLGLAGVAVLNRFVTRPLSDVAQRARQISAGSLEPVSSTRGPREVVAVTTAFDDVVQNLQLLQSQAAALASGDTSDPVLQEKVPGALGAAMQASVGRLSASLRARKELEGQLRHESTHDSLTGLLNRPAALVALEQGLARVNRSGDGLGVIQIDLDRLQMVNDIAGQGAGDEVLRAAATAIAGAARNGDVVARLGSDEFVVVAETLSVDVLMELSQRIIARLSEISVSGLIGSVAQLRASGLPKGIGASAGVAIAFDGVPDAASILRDAASAVRSAKRRGGGQIELLDAELRRALMARNQVSDGLRHALESGELRLHYQPIVDMDGRTTGVEALCRWTSPELGDVRPDVFIEAAEASDLVVELDRWVLGESLRQLAEWDAAGHLPGIYLSVNVSGRHLGDHRLVEDVASALRQVGIDPRRLLLEITETVLLKDLSVAARELSELRALGIRVAVDDFGTGYTSISHLQQLPVDIVKIDRSFITEMTQERGRALVKMMIEMASALGLSVVAEGVETAEELALLREMGCPMVQGFLLGRPSEPGQVKAGSTVVPAHADPFSI